MKVRRKYELVMTNNCISRAPWAQEPRWRLSTKGAGEDVLPEAWWWLLRRTSPDGS